MNNSIKPGNSEEMHVQIMATLPWYVNRSLDDTEHQHVQKHIEQCTVCQKEIETLQKLENAIQQQDTKTTWQPDRHHLQSIFNRIDDIDQTAQTPQTSTSVSIWQRISNQFKNFFDVSSAMRWTFAAQSALVIVLSVVLVLHVPEPTNTSFQTFSTEKYSSHDNNQQIRIVFSETMPLGELSSLLTSIPATIVQGPSQHGVFTIELEKQDADLTQALATLRQNTHVSFAEAVKLDK